jgi:catechol-2,3-dioxygenase
MEDQLFSGHHSLIIRARDLELLADFYERLGFRKIRRTENVVQLDAGGGGVLEIGRLAQEATPAPETTTRFTASVAGVFITNRLPEAIASALAAGGRKLETLPLPTAMVTFIADPEGNVIGLRQPAPEPPEETSQDVTVTPIPFSNN